MKVFLAGPIDYWWNENWESPAHIEYVEWRKTVNKMLVEAGHLVYRPHEAIKGAWDESMQAVNDLAISLCDVFVYLTPPNVPAYGTEAERKQAEARGLEVLHAPPGSAFEIRNLIVPLDDPYGNVQRKSYTKDCTHVNSRPFKRMVGRKAQASTWCFSCKREVKS